MSRSQQPSDTQSPDDPSPLDGGERMPSNGHEYALTDLCLASYLTSRGHRLVRLERNGWRCTFVFALTPALTDDELIFISRRATVEPLAFYEQSRLLKSMTQGQR